MVCQPSRLQVLPDVPAETIDHAGLPNDGPTLRIPS